MAGVVDRLRKRNKQQGREWTNTGSFISKPARGWLHPDEQLAPDAGVCYGVRYVGCMEVRESMKSLDFETRTAVAKESISRVCDAAGLKTATKKSKRGVKVGRLLGDEPQMVFAGSNVNLTITTECLTIMNIEDGDVIGIHHMPCISFASGGDPDTLDFVAYVAKDENGRLCHVLECGGGLAQDVITTIGQAFELRFKQYLAHKPQVISVERSQNNGACADRWGDEDEYYNDRVGAQPPDPPRSPTDLYAMPRSNRTVEGGAHAAVRESVKGNLIDFDTEITSAQVYDNQGRDIYNNAVGLMPGLGDDQQAVYDNPSAQAGEEAGSAMPCGTTPRRTQVLYLFTEHGAVNGCTEIYDNHPQADFGGIRSDSCVYNNRAGVGAAEQPALDAFDMKPFNASLPDSGLSPNTGASGPQGSGFPYHESWFHGKIGRDKCEQLLLQDGHFLVRESPNNPEQFVLSGRQGGRIKHLLLVDPQGVVRTKDRTFESVSHLVNYHMNNNVPITSTDNEMFLHTPVTRPVS